MKVYLVRHGRSAGNLPGHMTGWSEHPLTRLGVAQARKVAARLGPLGPMPVYSSDLPRALETAQIIADSGRGPAGGVGLTPPRRLREICLGRFEGRTWQEFTADRELARAFEDDPFTTAIPGGESLALVYERVAEAFRAVIAGSGSAACIVTHDGPIRTIINHVLKVPPERHYALSTSHGGLSLLETSQDWVSVRFLNDTCHLRGLDRSAAADAPEEAPTRAIEQATEGGVLE
jgi:broad specificity phosphatase PhoE